MPGSHCSHPKAAVGQDEAAADLGVGAGKGANTQWCGFAVG